MNKFLMVYRSEVPGEHETTDNFCNNFTSL